MSLTRGRNQIAVNYIASKEKLKSQFTAFSEKDSKKNEQTNKKGHENIWPYLHNGYMFSINNSKYSG